MLPTLCTQLGQRQGLPDAEVKAVWEVVKKMRTHGLRVNHHSVEAKKCAGLVGDAHVANRVLDALKG